MKRSAGMTVQFVLILALLVSVLDFHAPAVAAGPEIPMGATITSATLTLYVDFSDNSQEVRVHRVTGSWDELSVTWSTQPSYVPDPTATLPTTEGSVSADLTALVQSWVNDAASNHGILIEQNLVEQNLAAFTVFHSSESESESGALRPRLQVCYETTTPSSACVVIQEGVSGSVPDAYIWAREPDANYGAQDRLYTGQLSSFEKRSLLRFDFTLVPPPGTGTPGYWKNHPEAWPAGGITVGGVSYSREDAVSLLETAGKGDKSYGMFSALVSAKLNVAVGNDAACIADVIAEADTWMAAHPAGSGVAARSDDWQSQAASLHATLDAYNNGLLCAPHRE